MAESANSEPLEFNLERGLRVQASEDGLTATIIAKPKYLTGGGDISLAMLMEAIDKAGINRDRLDLTATEKAGASIDAEVRKPNKDLNAQFEYVIANGIPAKEGKNGWIKFYFPRAQRVVLKEDGSADFRNINKYVHVKEGEILATLFEGVAGEQGVDVTGKPIYPKAIDKPNIVIGKNILSKTKEDPENPGILLKEYFATLNGAVFSTDNSLAVSPELSIDTDVGLGTGNINFDGTIRVKGTIVEGANVVCNGSLYIDGNVESPDVIVGEDLEVKAGIKGKARGNVIRVRGELRAKFIENSVIEVDGDCIVENFILNSKILCLGSLILSGDSSSLVGSEIMAYKGVTLATLGSSAQLDTIIEVGFHYKNDRFFVEGTNRLSQYEKELETVLPEIQKIKEAVQRARGKVDESKKAKFKEVFDAYQTKMKTVELLKGKVEELKLSRYNPEPVKVVVRNTAHPGGIIRYRRQIEKITKQQSPFMMQFTSGQDKAMMMAWKPKS